jgi:hypothetical protein
MPKVRFIGDDGDEAPAQLLVLQQVAQQAHEGHRGRHFLASRAGCKSGI